MTVKELINELQDKPPTYEIQLGPGYGAYETSTDHDGERVIIWLCSYAFGVVRSGNRFMLVTCFTEIR